MANATLAKLTVQMNANSTKLVSELEKANKRADRWERRIKKNVSRVKLSFTGLASAIGAVKFAKFVTRSLQAADTIGKTADKIGISTKALQQLRYGADLAGVSTETLDMGMQRFARRLGEAQKGQGALLSTLKANNIAMYDQEGRARSVLAIFKDYADTVKNARTSQEQLQLTFQGFDSEAAGLVNMLRDGSIGIKKFSDEADRLGIVLDEKLIRNAAIADNKLTTLSHQWDAKKTALVVNYSDGILKLADSFVSLVDKASEVPKIMRFIGESIAAMVHGPADPERLAEKAGKLKVEIKGLQEEVARLENAQQHGNFLTRWIGGPELERAKKKLAEANAELKKTETLIGYSSPVKGGSVGLAPQKPPEPKAKPQKTDGTGGGNDLTKGAAYQQQLKNVETFLMDRSDMIASYVQTDVEKENSGYQERMNIIAEAYARGLISEQRYHNISAKLTKKHNKAMETLDKHSWKNRLALAGNIFGMLAGLMDSGSKRQFEIGKKAALATAIVKGIEAVQASFTAGADIGGPVVGAAFAAVAALATKANIDKINATQYGGGAGSISSSQTGGSVADLTNIPNVPGQDLNNTGGRPQQVHIVVEGSAVLTREGAQVISDGLQEYFNDGGKQPA